MRFWLFDMSLKRDGRLLAKFVFILKIGFFYELNTISVYIKIIYVIVQPGSNIVGKCYVFGYSKFEMGTKIYFRVFVIISGPPFF